jgi:hypothetical protein
MTATMRAPESRRVAQVDVIHRMRERLEPLAPAEGIPHLTTADRHRVFDRAKRPVMVRVANGVRA